MTIKIENMTYREADALKNVIDSEYTSCGVFTAKRYGKVEISFPDDLQTEIRAFISGAKTMYNSILCRD